MKRMLSLSPLYIKTLGKREENIEIIHKKQKEKEERQRRKRMREFNSNKISKESNRWDVSQLPEQPEFPPSFSDDLLK